MSARFNQYGKSIGLPVPGWSASCFQLLLMIVFDVYGMGAQAAQGTGSSMTCSSLTSLASPGLETSIRRAVVVPAGPVPRPPNRPPFTGTLPAYCLAEGIIDERVGHHGKSYAIKFAIALPENWNGRFLMQGGGGLNGTVNMPIGYVAAGDVPALARGFAVIATDSGHQGAIFDGSFFADQEAALNFLYQAVIKVAQAGKEIVMRFYGRNVAHSYFMGCSTGGREAMLMSQRYPRLFDGIVAGAPAMRTSFSNLADKWVTVSLNRVAPKDAQGQPEAARALSASDKQLVIQGLLKACDASDGVVDGMVSDPLDCHFDPAELACRGPKADDCLATEQVAALKAAFAGPKDSRAVSVYPGFWFDTGIAATAGIQGLLNPGPSPVAGPIFATTMDVDKEERLAATPISALGDTATWTELSTFSEHGGKLIFYHGVSDPWFSAQDTVRYYEQLKADNGGESVSNWSRLFLVPGMGHCGGGPSTLDQFDLIGPIVNWVERGESPESVIATGADFPGRSRPLCPYPKHAHYKGSGDSEHAENFECRNPSGR